MKHTMHVGCRNGSGDDAVRRILKRGSCRIPPLSWPFAVMPNLTSLGRPGAGCKCGPRSVGGFARTFVLVFVLTMTMSFPVRQSIRSMTGAWREVVLQYERSRPRRSRETPQHTGSAVTSFGDHLLEGEVEASSNSARPGSKRDGEACET